jgi:hypothetical protein
LPQINIGSEIVLALSFAVLNFFYKHYPQHVTSGARNIMKVTVGTEESPDRGKTLKREEGRGEERGERKEGGGCRREEEKG